MGERVSWLNALNTQEAEPPAEGARSERGDRAGRGEGDRGDRVDSAVAAWSEGAAKNKGALTKKQKADRARVRVKYDLPLDLKQKIEAAAKEEGTSASQLAMFLLGWAMEEYAKGAALREAIGDAKRPTRALRFDWDLELP